MRLIAVVGLLHLLVTTAAGMAREAGWRLAYWIRPYDMLADRRRWRWQKPAPCQHFHYPYRSGA